MLVSATPLQARGPACSCCTFCCLWSSFYRDKKAVLVVPSKQAAVQLRDIMPHDLAVIAPVLLQQVLDIWVLESGRKAKAVGWHMHGLANGMVYGRAFEENGGLASGECHWNGGFVGS